MATNTYVMLLFLITVESSGYWLDQLERRVLEVKVVNECLFLCLRVCKSCLYVLGGYESVYVCVRA